jgi:hypothetical protein
MGKSYDGIPPALSHWIEQQRVFFVATAPLARDGLFNCCPKGMADVQGSAGALRIASNGIPSHQKERTDTRCSTCASAPPVRAVTAVPPRGRRRVRHDQKSGALLNRVASDDGDRAYSAHRSNDQTIFGRTHCATAADPGRGSGAPRNGGKLLPSAGRAVSTDRSDTGGTRSHQSRVEPGLDAETEALSGQVLVTNV